MIKSSKFQLEPKLGKMFLEGRSSIETCQKNSIAVQRLFVFCLYPTHLLAEDALMESPQEGFRGVTLAYNVVDKNEVQQILERAEKVGAKIMKPAQDVFWAVTVAILPIQTAIYRK
jgi:hypothetical protein